MKNILKIVVCALAVVTIVGFMMPWATVATSVMGVSKEVTGALANSPLGGKVLKDVNAITDKVSTMGDIDIKSIVRGYQIPMMVNDKTSKVALSVAEIFFSETEGLEWKSYLVYLLPGLGILCGVLIFLGAANKLYVTIMTMLGGAVGIIGLFKLYTTNVSSLVVKISIQNGLWYTMYAFLFIGISGIAWLVADKKNL